MQRPGRKNPRLQGKLDAIEREISRMESEIRGISRAVETPDSMEALRRLKQVHGTGSNIITPTSGTPGVLVPEGSTSSRFAVSGVPTRPAQAVVDAVTAVQLPKAVPDQRFNTYFGTGSLHSVRPLRQERRVQRNKAIFMLIIAGLLIVMVLKMIS